MHGHVVARRVELQRPERSDRLVRRAARSLARRSTARMRATSSRGLKGLAQVVVGAELETRRSGRRRRRVPSASAPAAAPRASAAPAARRGRCDPGSITSSTTMSVGARRAARRCRRSSAASPSCSDAAPRSPRGRGTPTSIAVSSRSSSTSSTRDRCGWSPVHGAGAPAAVSSAPPALDETLP